MSLGLRTHQVGLEASIEAAVKKVNRAGVAVKVRASDFTQPLGKMSAKANEFTKSLEASNARVIAFGASAAIIGGVTTSFVQLVVQAQKVEKILGDINAVLGASAATLQQFGDGLFNVARNTSQALEVAAEAALEFSRQGLSMEETLKRTNDALILTRLTGLAAADSVKGLTAAVNGFADAGLNTTEIINKLAAVDVKFAVSAEDLINSLARAGAVAQDAGVSFDQLIGAVTSAQQITARGGAVIGNSFKTIFTRIQRSSTLDRLEELGIAVRDLQGNTLPALTVLTELSRSYETLGAATKAAVAEQVGGVFQINILKAALKDLGRENSLYSQATITSSKATNEAYTKNAMLQKTLSSIATQTLTTVRELTANLGELTIAPALKEFLENINGVLKTVSDLLGTDEGESIGADFAKGLARAVGSVLSGPGLFGLVMVFGKLFGQAFKFAKDSVKDLLQIKSIKDQERMIQESIVEAMMTNVELSKQLVRLDGDQVKQEKLVLAVLREQTATIEQQRKIATNIAPALRRSGVQPNLVVDSKKNAASGHIPSPVEKLKERSGAKKAGYIAGEVSTMSIPRLGRVVYNKKEKVKKFKGMDQPAIMPPEYSKAGKQYRKNFTGKHGFDPYAHSGMVPNFVRYDKSVRPWRALPDNANAKGYGGVFTGREVEKMRNDGWARTDAKGWHFVGGGRKAVDRVEKKARDDNRDMILGASAMRRGGKMIVDNKSGQIYHGTDHQQIAQQNNLFENGKLPRSMIPVHMQKEYDPTIDKDVNKIFVRAPSASSLNPVSMRKLQSITEKDYGVLVLDAGRGFTGGQKVLYDPNNFYGNFSGMSEGLIPNYSYYAPGMEDFYQRNRNPKTRDRNKKKASRKDLNLEFFYPSAGTGGGTIFKMYKDIIRSAEAGKPYTNILAGEIIGPRIPKMIVEGKKLIDRSRRSGKKIPKMQIDGTLFPSMLTRKIDKFASDRRDGYIHPPVDYMPGEESEVRKYLQTMGVDPDSHSTVRLQDIYKGGFNSGLIPNYVLEAARLGNTNILKMPKAKMITETTASNFKGEKIKGWKTLEATLDNISKSAQSYRDEFAILKSLGIDVIQRPFYFSDQTSKIDKKEMRKISKAQRLLRGSSKNSFAYKNQHKITGSSYESSLEGSALSSQGYRSTWEGEFNKQGIKQGLGDQNAKVDFIKAGRSPLEGKYGKYTAPNLIAKSIRLSSDQYIESFLKKHGQSDIANLMSSKKLDDSKKLLSSMGFSDPDASTVSKYRLFNGYLPNFASQNWRNQRSGDPQRGKHEAKATKAQILKAIKLVLKNRGVGKTAMGSNKIDFASERYMSATKTREYPGGYVNIDGERINMNEITLALKKHGQYHPSFADDDEFDGSMNHKDNIILDDSQQNHLPNFMRSMRGSFGRSPLKFGIGGEKSFGKSYLGTTSKSGKMFLLQEGYPYFSSYMEKMGKPKPELKAGNFGGRAGYWVNNYENDVRTWAELPNTKILDLDRKRKDEQKKLDADRLARTKSGVFDPVLTNGKISFSDGSSGFVNTNTLSKIMGEKYKHLEVDKFALQEYAKQNSITRRSIGSDIPDLPKALSNIVGMPRNQLLALKNIVRPRAQTKTEADVDKFFKSPKKPIKWDVRDDDKGKKQFNLKADDATFLHFTEFLKKEGVPQRSINNIHTALASKRQSLDDIADRAKEKRRGGRGKDVFFKAAKQQEAIEQGFSIPTNSLYIKNLNQLVREFNKTVYSGSGFAEGLIPNFMIQSHILNNKKLTTASGTISGSVPYEKRVHTPNSWTHFKPKPNQRLDGPRGTLDGLTKNIKKLDKPSQKARISKEDFRTLKPSDDWWIFQTKGGRLYENMLTPFIGKAGHNSHLDYDPYSIKNKDVISNDGTAGSLRAGFSVADAHAGMGHPAHLNVAKLVRSGKLTRQEIESHMTSGKSYDASANDGFVEIVGGRSRDNTYKSKFGMKASTLKKQGFLRSSFPEKTPSGAIKRFSMSYYQDAFRPTSASGLIPNFAAWNPFTRDSKSIAKQGGIANSKFSLAKIIQSSPFKHQLTRYGHWNNFPPDVKKRLNQWLRSQGYANRALQGWGLLSKHSKSIASGVNDLAVYNGHVPNFSSPLTEAISREKHALREQGSSADIYIDQDNRLKNPKNPSGLLVANTRDEPKSGSQGVNRAISMGMDPKTHGASDGVVPNYSMGFSGRSNTKSGRSDQSPKTDKVNETADNLMMKMMALTTVTYALEGAMGGASEKASDFQKTIGVANASIMGLSQAAMLFTMMPKSFMPSLKNAAGQNTMVGGMVDRGKKMVDKGKSYASAKLGSSAGGQKLMSGAKGLAGAAGKVAGGAMAMLGPLGIAIAVLIPVITALKDHFGLFMSATETATKHLEGLQSGLASIEQATQAVTSMQGRQSKIIELENVGKDRSIAQEKEYLTLQIEEMKNRTSLDNAINKVASSFDLTNEENINSTTTQKLLNGTYEQQIEVLGRMEQAQLRLINMASGSKNLAEDLEGADGDGFFGSATEEQLRPFLRRSGVGMAGQMGLDFSKISDDQLSLLDTQIESLKNSFSGGADDLGEINIGDIQQIVQNLKGNTVTGPEKESMAAEIQKRIQISSRGTDNAFFSEDRQERSAGVTLDAFRDTINARVKASRKGEEDPNKVNSKFITALKNQGDQFLKEQNFLLTREISLMEARLDLEEKGLELQRKMNGFFDEDIPSYFKLISKDEKIDRATARKTQGLDDKLSIDMGRLDIETNSEIDKALAELMKPEDFAQALFSKMHGFQQKNLKYLEDVVSGTEKLVSLAEFETKSEKMIEGAESDRLKVEKSLTASNNSGEYANIQGFQSALLGHSEMSDRLGLENAFNLDPDDVHGRLFGGDTRRSVEKNEEKLRKFLVDKGGMDETTFLSITNQAKQNISDATDNYKNVNKFSGVDQYYSQKNHDISGYASALVDKNQRVEAIKKYDSADSFAKGESVEGKKAQAQNKERERLQAELTNLKNQPTIMTGGRSEVIGGNTVRAMEDSMGEFGKWVQYLSMGQGIWQQGADWVSGGALGANTGDRKGSGIGGTYTYADAYERAQMETIAAPTVDKEAEAKKEAKMKSIEQRLAQLDSNPLLKQLQSPTGDQGGSASNDAVNKDNISSFSPRGIKEKVKGFGQDFLSLLGPMKESVSTYLNSIQNQDGPSPVTPDSVRPQSALVDPSRMNNSPIEYGQISGRLDDLARDPSMSEAEIAAAVSSALESYTAKLGEALESSKVFTTDKEGNKEKSLDSQVLSGIMKDVFQNINSPDIKIKLAEAITKKGITSNMEQEQTKIITEIKGQAIEQKDKTAKLQQETALAKRGIKLEALKQKFQERTLDGYRIAQAAVGEYADVQGDMLSAARDDLKGREYWAGLDEAMGQIELQNLKELQSTGALYAAQRGEAEVSLTRQIMANFTEKGRLKALNDSKDMTEKGAQLARDGFDLEAEKQRTTLIELNNKLNLSDISERLYDQVKTESEIKVKQLNLENKRLAQQQKLYETTEALTKEVQEELTQQTQNKYQSQQRSAESFRLRGQVISDENNPFFGQNMTQEQANAQLRAGEIGGSNRDAIASARADYQLYTGRGNDLRASDARLQMLQAQKQSNLENDSGSLFSDTIAVRIAEANSEMERFGETLGNLTFDSVQQGLKDVVTAMADGTKSMKDALMGFVGGIANAVSNALLERATKQVTTSVFSMLGMDDIAEGKYRGGLIQGYASGGSTSKAPAMLTAGEYVVRKKIVDRLGTSSLNKMNKTGTIDNSLSDLYSQSNEDSFDMSTEGAASIPPIMRFNEGGKLNAIISNITNPIAKLFGGGNPFSNNADDSNAMKFAKGAGYLGGSALANYEDRDRSSSDTGPTAPVDPGKTRLNTSSSLDIDPTSRMMSARFRKQDSYSRQYGDYLLAKYDHDIQKQNAKVMENAAVLQGIAGNVTGALVGTGISRGLTAVKALATTTNNFTQWDKNQQAANLQQHFYEEGIDSGASWQSNSSATFAAARGGYNEMKGADLNKSQFAQASDLGLTNRGSVPNAEFLEKSKNYMSTSSRNSRPNSNKFPQFNQKGAKDDFATQKEMDDLRKRVATAELKKGNNNLYTNSKNFNTSPRKFNPVAANREVGQGHAQGQFGHHYGMSTGGRVHGPSGRDQVGPVMLDKGEYVIRASSVNNIEKKYPGFFDKLNSMKMNEGGLVTPSPKTEQASPETPASGGGAVTVNINVSSGGGATAEGGGASDQAFAAKIKDAVVGVISQEKRVGGMLNG